MNPTLTGIGGNPVPLYEFSSLPSIAIEAEAAVYRVENDLLRESSNIQDKNDRGHYKRLVLREKDSLIAKIKTMRATGMPVQAIKEEVNRAIVQLETSARQFIAGCEGSQSVNASVADQFAAITARTNTSSQLQFAAFTPPSSSSTADKVRTAIREGAKLSAREDVGSSLALLRAGAAVADGVGYVVSAGAKKVCAINSTTQQVCQGAANVATTVLQATGLDEAYTNLTSTADDSISGRMENELSIPRQEVAQGLTDAVTVASGAVVGTVVHKVTSAVGIGNAVPRSVIGFINDEAGAVKLPNLKSLLSKDMVDAFKGLGYKIVPGGGKGSHTKLAKEGYPAAIIPNKRELPNGTANSIWKTYKDAKVQFDSHQ
jgi:predicted RNA binding protein YcfA (HicA-like mRNA interferase family)